MISTQETAFSAARQTVGRAPTSEQSALFASLHPLPSALQLSETEGESESCSDLQEKIKWTHEEIVMLHGILFDTCVDQLNDPETPLDEVLDCLRWIFSEPGKEASVFSFSNTLRLYQRPQAWGVREAIQAGLKRYLGERLARYPAWVAQAFWSDPDRFADELERNPQWINEGVRRFTRDGDLFAA
jgi:hypothetical protein